MKLIYFSLALSLMPISVRKSKNTRCRFVSFFRHAFCESA